MPLSRTFVEVGSADGLENNTHQLLLDGFKGVWVDGADEKIRFIGEVLGQTVSDRLWALNARVSLDTVELLGKRAARFLGVQSVDFLSLDIDGNDWHVLSPLLHELNPKLVCAEYNAKFPPPLRLVMQYNEQHHWGGNDYFGASLQSFTDKMEAEGYTLVCCNLTGANAFFVRKDVAAAFAAYSIDTLFQPPRYHLIKVTKGHLASLLWAKEALKNGTAIARFVPVTKLREATCEFAVHTETDQYVSEDIARDGVWEPFETTVFTRVCRAGDTVLDLGANIGWYSALAANCVGREGGVLAFEPDETDRRLLEINAAVLIHFRLFKFSSQR